MVFPANSALDWRFSLRIKLLLFHLYDTYQSYILSMFHQYFFQIDATPSSEIDIFIAHDVPQWWTDKKRLFSISVNDRCEEFLFFYHAAKECISVDQLSLLLCISLAILYEPIFHCLRKKLLRLRHVIFFLFLSTRYPRSVYSFPKWITCGQWMWT